jgi:hypothetical protein
MTGLLSRRTVVALWALALLAISVAVSIKPGKLYRTFATAGEHFRKGEPLYPSTLEDAAELDRQHLELFRYTPLIAASFIPLSFLPDSVGAILWRIFQALALLLALREWAKTCVPPVPWPALALLVLPLAAGNFHNAQVNPLVLAMMLFGVVTFARDRYWLSAVAIAVATAYKVYPISLGLLLCVLEPKKYTPKLLLFGVLAFVLPFGLQSPSYVWEQYEGLEVILRIDDRSMQPMHEGYYDVQKLLRLYGWTIPLTAYRAIEAAAGCAAAAFVYWGRRRGWSRALQLHACAGLGMLWCTLFGPSTESATYMLLAPLVAHAVIDVTGRALRERIAVRGAYAVFIGSQMVVWFPREISDPIRGTLIPQAHATLVLLIWFVWRVVQEGRAMDVADKKSVAST